MELPMVLTFVIAAFIWSQRHKTFDSEFIYSDFSQMLKKSSQMCDEAIQNILHIVSHGTNQNFRSFDILNNFFDKGRCPANASKTIDENGTCKAGLWKDSEEILLYNNAEECFEMIKIEKHLEGILKDMLQSRKEITSVKKKFPGVIEVNCAGKDDGENCRIQILLSARSLLSDLLSEASVNVKIVDEIMIIYQRIAAICFENMQYDIT